AHPLAGRRGRVCRSGVPPHARYRRAVLFPRLHPSARRHRRRRILRMGIAPHHAARWEYGVVCYYFDSTKLREAEQALRRSQAWLRGQKEAFQASMTGKPLETSLAILVRSAVEHVGGDARASFFLVNPEGTAIRRVAGMSEEYGRVVGDFPVGADAI